MMLSGICYPDYVLYILRAQRCEHSRKALVSLDKPTCDDN
jgi:hypothetical protein